MKSDSELMQKVIDGGVRLALKAKTVGYAQVWAVHCRSKLSFTDRPDVTTWSVYTNGKVLMNRAFTESLSPGNVEFLIAHEILHLANSTTAQAEAAGIKTPEEFELFNLITDAVNNEILTNDGVGSVTGLNPIEMKYFREKGYTGPAEALKILEWARANKPPPPEQPECDDESEQADGQPGEQGAGQEKPKAGQGCGPLKAESEPNEGQGPQDQPGDDGEGQGSDGEGAGQPGQGQGQASQGGPSQGQASEEMLATLVKATLTASADPSTALARHFAPVARKTSWRSMIRAGFEVADTAAENRDISSYAGFSMAESHDRALVRKGKIGTETRVAFIADISGSMHEVMEKLQGEILKLASEFPETEVYLVTHTSDVAWQGWLKRGGDKATVKRATGYSGGTEFKPAYDAVAKAGRFDAVVHFTDGETYEGTWPKMPARKGIVALSHGRESMTRKPPSGVKVVEIDCTAK